MGLSRTSGPGQVKIGSASTSPSSISADGSRVHSKEGPKLALDSQQLMLRFLEASYVGLAIDAVPSQ